MPFLKLHLQCLKYQSKLPHKLKQQSLEKILAELWLEKN